MSKPVHHLRPPQSYIHGLEKTNEYLDLLGQGKERTIALGHVAGMFADRMARAEEQSTEQRLNRCAVNILSALPDFIHARHALDAIQDEERKFGRKLSRQKRPFKEASISYNHAIHELIDVAPDIKPADIKAFAFEATLTMADPSEAKFCAQETQGLLHSIQQEIGLEQILWHVDGVEDVVHGSKEDEFNAGDLIVIYRGMRLLVDAKSSHAFAEKALMERTAYAERNKISEANNKDGYPIWTGLDIADFGGTFRIPDRLAAKKAPRVAAILERLYEQKTKTA